LREIGAYQFRDGDVLLFRWQPHLPARHVGIATSPSTMVHAQSQRGRRGAARSVVADAVGGGVRISWAVGSRQ